MHETYLSNIMHRRKVMIHRYTSFECKIGIQGRTVNSQYVSQEVKLTNLVSKKKENNEE